MNFKSIKVRLIGLTLISMLILGLSIMTIALERATTSQVDSRLEQLDAIKESKKAHIQSFFSNLATLLQTKANDAATIEKLWAINDAYEALEDEEFEMDAIRSELASFYERKELSSVNYDFPGVAGRQDANALLPTTDAGLIAQYLYVAQNPHPFSDRHKMTINKEHKGEYSSLHIEYHNGFTELQEGFGLYDVYMVNLSGDVLYTVSKKIDFATNLAEGPYKDSGLGRVYEKAMKLKRNQIAFEDFSSYLPSFNAQAAFMATPLYYKDDLEGVLIYQIPVDLVNNIMNFNNEYEKAGLGQTGNAYLIGMDNLMRTESRFTESLEDAVIKSAKTTIGVKAVNSASVDAYKRGESGSQIVEVEGIRKLSSYASAGINGTDWGIIVEINEDEALQSVTDTRNLIIITSLVILVVLAILSVTLIQSLVIGKLDTLQTAAHDLAKGEGDLTQRIVVPKGDEIHQVAEDINAFIEKVRITVSEAKRSSIDNTAIAKELSGTSQMIGSKVLEESNIVRDVSQTGQELQKTLEDAIIQAEETKTQLDSAGLTLQAANQKIISLAENVNHHSAVESELSARLQQLSQDAQQVKDILTVISDIADQTNLLALNAAIEAARAGEHGRGFAVVADEVRKLAERTQKSLSEIHASINVIVQSITDTSDQIEHNAKAIEELSNEAHAVESEITQSVEGMERSLNNVDETVTGYIENSKTVQEMITKVEAIDELSSHNTKSVEEISASSENLLNMTAKLKQMLEQYRT